MATTPSLMLFGSAARGECIPSSDIDVLCIDPASLNPVREPASRLSPLAAGSTKLDLLVRPPLWLDDIASAGELFALHLQVDGRIISDESGILRRFLRRPVRVNIFARQRALRLASASLHASDLDTSSVVTHRVAKHLLRTATFLECARLRRPSFSYSEAPRILRDKTLEAVLRDEPSERAFLRIRSKLSHLAGPPGGIPMALATYGRTHHTAHTAHCLLAQNLSELYDPEPIRTQHFNAPHRQPQAA
jgi:hypothetical protein